MIFNLVSAGKLTLRRRLLRHGPRDLPDAGGVEGRLAELRFGGREPVRYALPRPKLPAQPAPAIPTHGNFTVPEEFAGSSLAPYWMMLRTPHEPWWERKRGALTLQARPEDIAGRGQPSFVGRRQHYRATFTTSMHFAPTSAGDRAGLVAFQSENFFYGMTVTLVDGKPVVQVERRAGRNDTSSVIASKSLAARSRALVYLRIDADGDHYGFSFSTERGQWIPVLENADGRMLSTKGAGVRAATSREWSWVCTRTRTREGGHYQAVDPRGPLTRTLLKRSLPDLTVLVDGATTHP